MAHSDTGVLPSGRRVDSIQSTTSPSTPVRCITISTQMNSEIERSQGAIATKRPNARCIA